MVKEERTKEREEKQEERERERERESPKQLAEKEVFKTESGQKQCLQ